MKTYHFDTDIELNLGLLFISTVDCQKSIGTNKLVSSKKLSCLLQLKT